MVEINSLEHLSRWQPCHSMPYTPLYALSAPLVCKSASPITVLQLTHVNINMLYHGEMPPSAHPMQRPAPPAAPDAITPDLIAFPPPQGSLDLSPWLYVIPSELAPFRDLLAQFGVTESFSAQQYVAVLREMHDAAGEARPLDEHQLRQAIAVVQVGGWVGGV